MTLKYYLLYIVFKNVKYLLLKGSIIYNVIYLTCFKYNKILNTKSYEHS